MNPSDPERRALQRAIDIIGGQAAVAELVGLGPKSVWPWLHLPGRRVPIEHCPAIERATHGKVRCEDLRPDIEWSVLRASKRVAAQRRA